MKTNYVLIDFENVRVKSLALLEGDHFRIFLFLGPNHTKIPRDLVLAMHALGQRAQYVQLESAGPNALDFHIAYYLGVLGAADPAGFFHVISADTGFDPLIAHLRGRSLFAARSESIEAMPCFRPAAPKNGGATAENTGDSLTQLLKIVIDDLIKRKSAKPRRVATLRSTVLARIGKDAAGSVDAVVAALVREGIVNIEGDKITYHLPN